MHDLAFRAGGIRRHFHHIHMMVAADEVQEESAESNVGHSDFALEGYRAIELSASAAARNIDPGGDEFDGHFGLPLRMAALTQQDCTVVMLPPCGRTVDPARRCYPCATPDHARTAQMPCVFGACSTG